jgi:hypothetical protein
VFFQHVFAHRAFFRRPASTGHFYKNRRRNTNTTRKRVRLASLSLSLSARSKEPGFDDKREARKSFEKFLFFFFFDPRLLKPYLKATLKGKKGYERGGGFPIANNDTILVNPRARRT